MYDCLQFLSIVATIIVIVQSGFGWIKIVEGESNDLPANSSPTIFNETVL